MCYILTVNRDYEIKFMNLNMNKDLTEEVMKKQTLHHLGIIMVRKRKVAKVTITTVINHIPLLCSRIPDADIVIHPRLHVQTM